MLLRIFLRQAQTTPKMRWRQNTSYRSKWTVCIFPTANVYARSGTKIRIANGIAKLSGLTDSFKALLDKYSIAYPDGEDIREKKLTEQTSTEFFKGDLLLLSLTLQMRNSETNSEIDYLISPVRDKTAISIAAAITVVTQTGLPTNADANGAYNIARKALWCIEQIKATDDDELKNVKLAISNKQWLEYVQKRG